MAGLSFAPEVYALLSTFVEERTGLHYGYAQRELLADKISTRAVEAGFDSLLDYYYFLRYDDAGGSELDALIDVLVVGETYFFREVEPLRVLVDEVLAPAVAARRRPRVWCAACSTGEEPLTLAMLLAERGLLEQVDVTASDISRRALARAQAGEYNRRSLRQLPAGGEAARWLRVDGTRVQVAPEVRERLGWRRVNLIDREAVRSVASCDAIVCRNVLIYFRDERARAVVDDLASVLRPGGVLLVGVSESLLRFGTTLRWEERRGAFFYRKVAE